MRRIILTAFTLMCFLSTRSNAQSIKSFKFLYPIIDISPENNKVFLEPIKVSQSVGKPSINAESLNTKFQSRFENVVKSSAYGQNQSNMPFEWMRTDLLILSETKEDADMIVSGSMNVSKYSTSLDTTYKKMVTEKEQLPYEIVTFQGRSSFKMEWDMVCKSKNGEVLKNLPSQVINKSDVSKEHVIHPAVHSKNQVTPASTFYQSAISTLSSNLPFYFKPQIQSFNLNYSKIKNPSKKDLGGDKVLAKEIKSDLKEIKKTLTKYGDHRGAFDLNLALLEKWQCKDLYYNIGVFYESQGCFTKALEWYKKSEYNNPITRIEQGLKAKEFIESFGKDVTEPEI
ncbi:tetratricopeptide repeat protein [Flammeovirga aprica]|uniref:Tetratricopeptide repeat protein n=1 Tax=Flammeovirga aprica JL-4 TaxID=694437 RepID=A0A7X9RZZ0_9BACT|nr:tetratricopeptide repeat protein [Flammeovirga aprica]NME71724.1 hypothetical protein [Flammeovirga aprica JL-4]